MVCVNYGHHHVQLSNCFFILEYWPFKHQTNKIFLLVVLTFIFVVLLTYKHRTFQMKPCESTTFLHFQHLILSFSFIGLILDFTIKTIMNLLHVLHMWIIYIWLFLLRLWIFVLIFTQHRWRSFITKGETSLQVLHCVNACSYTLDFSHVFSI